MRKLLIILIGLLCCSFTAAGDGVRALHANAPTVLSIDQASNDQWLCEREYNSDLNLPRLNGEVSAQVTTARLVRSVISDASARTINRLATLSVAAGSPKATSYNKPFDSVVGPHAVDYYVFRLRRLII